MAEVNFYKSVFVQEELATQVSNEDAIHEEVHAYQRLCRNVMLQHLSTALPCETKDRTSVVDIVESWMFILDMQEDNPVYEWVDGAGICRNVYKQQILEHIQKHSEDVLTAINNGIDHVTHKLKLLKTAGGLFRSKYTEDIKRYNQLADTVVHLLSVKL